VGILEENPVKVSGYNRMEGLVKKRAGSERGFRSPVPQNKEIHKNALGGSPCAIWI